MMRTGSGKKSSRFRRRLAQAVLGVLMAALALRAQEPTPSAAPSIPNEAGPTHLDRRTKASDPGGVGLSAQKLQVFKDELSREKIPLPPQLPDDVLEKHLRFGDSRAAVVVRTQPDLLVAAYSDELDCVVMLRFDPAFVNTYGLAEGSRLLTINTYGRKSAAGDLHEGPKSAKRWTSVSPLIAEFVSDDMDRIAARKAKIADEEWLRASDQGAGYVQAYGTLARDGNPYLSSIPAGRAASVPSRVGLEYGGLTFGKATPADVKAVAGDFHGCQADAPDSPDARLSVTRCTVIVGKGSEDNPASVRQEFVFQGGSLSAVRLTASDAATYEALAAEAAKQYGTDSTAVTLIPERARVLIVDQPLRVGVSVAAPKLVRRVEPDYSEEARKARLEGVVIVEATISVAGNVEDVRVLKCPHPTLCDAAVHAVSQWKYKPAMFDADPVRVYLTVTSTFSLNTRPKRS